MCLVTISSNARSSIGDCVRNPGWNPQSFLVPFQLVSARVQRHPGVVISARKELRCLAKIGGTALAALVVSLLAPASAFGGEIHGRVLNAQGAPVAGATVTVNDGHDPPAARVVTAADGSYAVPNLEPGTYVVTVSEDGQQMLRREVAVGNEAAPARADFRFAVTAEDVTGFEERN